MIEFYEILRVEPHNIIALNGMGIGFGNLSLQDMLLGIGGKVLEIRKSKGLNQGELATLAGGDRAYISLVENGKQNLTLFVWRLPIK